ncbi:hypothetical protein [uncultured Piscinibacter sp.]|uniref:hypothetical protein n=1 Tax=uncultured Piscinibacter sp. TaxID=1131835 RepID=UPI0026222914|nr:hypothetical protein [uncultured Piscinibacter sp.]
MWLKQSTAVTIRLGPFLDKADGVTEETGASPSVEVSKNHGAFAARNSASAITHDSNGWFSVPLDTTDTNTLGPMVVKSDDSATFLPVWREFLVVPAVVYDALVAGSDTLQVDLTQIDGQATSGNNATLNLKKLNIVNNAGDALVAQSTGSNGHGAAVTGHGSGHGAHFTGGTTGDGIRGTGGGTSGDGMHAEAQSDGNGLHVVAVGTGNAGLRANATAAPGIEAEGGGANAGFKATGGATGHGLHVVGGATSGDGLHAEATTSGDGIQAVGAGAGGDLVADELAAIKAKTDNLPSDPADESSVLAAIAALNNLSSGGAQAAAAAALAAYGAATGAQVAAVEADTQDLQLQIGVDGAGLTAIGDARLANLDAAVSSRATLAAADVWAVGTRTLTSYGTLIADIWAGMTSAAANKQADHVWRRTLANIAASSDGDAVTFRSPLGAMRKLVNKLATIVGVLTIYEEDDTTVAGQQAMTTDPTAENVTALDTA